MAEDYKVVRVLCAIPNEGHTQVEAYANRLMNWMHLGRIERESEICHDLRKENPEMEKWFLENKAIYMNKPYTRNKVFEFYFTTMGRMFTPIARNEACKRALEIKADYVYFIDDDMIAPDDLFLRLYRHDVDIVCPLAFTRNYDHKPVIYVAEEGIDPLTKQYRYVNRSVMKYPRNKLVEADSCGFGAALIKTWILKKMPEPWFSLTSDTGEDLLFCIHARKHGAKVYADTSTKLGHLGHPPNITEDYVDVIRKSDPMFEKKNGHWDKYEAKVILGE